MTLGIAQKVREEKMSRSRVLPMRMSDAEMATFQALAQAEKLPVTTMIRKLLLDAAESHGLGPIANRGAKVSEAQRAAIASK